MSGSSDIYLDAILFFGHDLFDSAMDAYTKRVGKRLRTVREERLYTLRDVERESGVEFKSSVISAYERGERMMSVQRLDRLAQFYDVPVSHLLPREEAAPELEVASTSPRSGTPPPGTCAD